MRTSAQTTSSGRSRHAPRKTDHIAAADKLVVVNINLADMTVNSGYAVSMDDRDIAVAHAVVNGFQNIAVGRRFDGRSLGCADIDGRMLEQIAERIR